VIFSQFIMGVVYSLVDKDGDILRTHTCQNTVA